MVHLINFKYRIYPTNLQIKTLDSWLWTCKNIYNELLDLHNDLYIECGYSVTKFDGNTYIKVNELGKGIIHSQVAQNINDRVNKAFDKFFQIQKESSYKFSPKKLAKLKRLGKKPTLFDMLGHPKYKSIRQYNSFTFPQSGFELVDGRYIKLSKIGKIKIKMERSIIGKIKTCTIKRNHCGQWFAVFSVEQTDAEFFEPINHGNKAIGLDIGIKKFCALSDGTIVDNPKFLKKAEKRLKRAQRKLSKKTLNSNEFKNQSAKLAKIHNKVANQRRNFHYQIAHYLANNYDCIAVENVSPQFMLKNHHMAKAASDVGWSQFLNILEYECFKHNTKCGKVDKNNTSQICSQCGNIVKKGLKERVHRCPYCGLVCDRDINAAINIVYRIPSEILFQFTPLINGMVGTTKSLTLESYKPVESPTSGTSTIGIKLKSENLETATFR